MSRLLQAAPFSVRDDALFLEEMKALCRHHRHGCPEYARITQGTELSQCERVSDLPFLHSGLFKHLLLRTESGNPEEHARLLLSSSTRGQTPSRIALDARSSQLQSEASLSVFKDLVGSEPQPLLVLDHVRNLRRRGEVSARIAAAMSLQPLSSETHFVLESPDGAPSIQWNAVRAAAKQARGHLRVYGFTWILWQAWAQATLPDEVRDTLRTVRIDFVHSGGWKKLDALAVPHHALTDALLTTSGPGSRVVDFYGLVEQVGVIFPLCEGGFRHAPRWADVLVRDPYTLTPLEGETGQLQLLNTLAHGAPYHSILTEDLGRLTPGACECGRPGVRFELLGRVPKAELRGCGNV